MRRLEHEDGATALIVTLLLAVMLGAAALAIDAGNLYWERRMLQNAADAAALAVAMDCAAGDCGDAQDTATDIAVQNDARGANVDDLDIDLGAGQVTVITRTGDEEGNAGVIENWLIPILDEDLSESVVRARAAARWGAYVPGGSLPFAISVCDYAHFAHPVDESGNPIDEDDDETPVAGYEMRDEELGERVFHYKTDDVDEECRGPANQQVPSGWGWLDEDDCEARIDDDGWMDNDPGNDVPHGCSPEYFADLVGSTVAIPIFDQENELTGGNARYHIYGYAAFELTGYRLSGSPAYNVGPESSDLAGCSGNERCLYGRFIEFTFSAPPADDEGGLADLGARYVRLSE